MWLSTPALRQLVESEGGRWPAGELEERIAALHDFSTRWDFRSGAERLDIDDEADGLDERQAIAAGDALGMTVADLPRSKRYDHGLALGGTALASIYRVKRLFELRDFDVEIARRAVLTALREIKSPELEIVAERPDIAVIAEGAESEFDVMVRAVGAFAGREPCVLRSPNENPHLASATAEVDDTLVLAAPSADPGRRANTRDNYNVYTERIGPTDSVLIVTSSIYLPYQFFIALQALGWDVPRTIEAIGFPPEWMQGVLTGPRNVLQELHSALFGALTTVRALGDDGH